MNIFKALFGKRKQQPAEEIMDTPNFEKLKRDGIGALNSNNPALAVELLTQALSIDNADVECRDGLSQAYEVAGDLSNAYEQLQSIAELQPSNISLLLRMAELASRMHNYTAMSDVCEKYILTDNHNARAYELYAMACRGLGDETNAAAMLTMAERLRRK